MPRFRVTHLSPYVLLYTPLNEKAKLLLEPYKFYKNQSSIVATIDGSHLLTIK